MELRKDPGTRSGVVTGEGPSPGRNPSGCPFVPELVTLSGFAIPPWAIMAAIGSRVRRIEDL